MRRLLIAAATAVIGVTATAARQTQPAAPRPQFRSSVETVHVDVSVLDRNRRPVRGLTPADFTILESGLVLTATPGPTAAPRDALKAILPVVPTARRTFTAGDQVTVFVRVYQGGKTPIAAVPLRIRLTDERGTVITDRQQDVSIDRFTRARSADVGADVPMARLAAGEYLLTVQAGPGGATVRRDSRFRVLPGPLQQRQ